MPGQFGGFRVRIEPWAAEYGPQWQADEAAEEPESPESLDVEVPLSDWVPITPAGALAPATTLFVDGVRRVDAFVAVDGEQKWSRGLFGSYAAGAVVVRDQTAAFGPAKVGHVVICGDGLTLPASIPLMPGVVYEPLSTNKADHEALLLALQTQMRSTEAQLAREMADWDDTLVIVDGPLAYMERRRGATIGYIKSIRNWHVPASAVRVIHALPAGKRSPMVVLSSGGRIRYTWYLRLAEPWPGDAPFAGVVRLEVSQTVGLDAAKRLADACTTLLPRFIPPRGTDPRAPANLLPIGAIERDLRHRLGDQLLIHRRIQALIIQEARHVH
jgi:hypothetical protein